jgi:hypothetical protein
MMIVADGMEVTGSTTSRVVEEEETRDLFFFRGASRLSRKLFGGSKPLIHYPIFIPPKRERKQVELACKNYGYHYMHVTIVYAMLDVSF